MDHTDESDRVATVVDASLHAPVHTHATYSHTSVHTNTHSYLFKRGLIIFKELFINVFPPGKVRLSAEEAMVPERGWGKSLDVLQAC